MEAWIATERTILELTCAAILWLVCVLLAALRFRKETTHAPLRRAFHFIVAILFASILAALFVAPTLERNVLRPPEIVAILDDSASMARNNDDRDVYALAEKISDAFQRAAYDRQAPSRTMRLSGSETFAGVDLPPFSPLPESENARILYVSDDRFASWATLPEEKRFAAVRLGPTEPALNWSVRDLHVDPPFLDDAEAFLSVTVELQGANQTSGAMLELWKKKQDDAGPQLLWSEPILPEKIDSDPSNEVVVSRTWNEENEPEATFLLILRDNSAVQGSFDAIVNDLDASADRNRKHPELCLADNAILFNFKPVKPIRALLVDDLPGKDYVYLREALRREENVDLKTMLLSADPLVVRNDPNMLPDEPLDRKTLESFDVVVIGDLLPEDFLKIFARLPEVVTREGSKTSVWFSGAARLCADKNWPDSKAATIVPGRPIVSELAGNSPGDDPDLLLNT
ncbi:MAG: hypothetical protein HUK08_02875, partial [Bacteroidaceae bacterium]|nr:hypothetical protein [Bacteroidaceae bacterium]